MSIAETYQWMGVLIAVGCLQSSFENLFLSLKFPVVNQFNLQDTKLVRPYFSWLSFGFDSPGIWAVYLVKLILAITMLIGSLQTNLLWWLPLTYIFVEFLGYQRQYLLINSEMPIQRIILVCIAIHFYCDDVFISKLSLYFVFLQICIAYFAAGWHKFKSKSWHDASVFSFLLKRYLPISLQKYMDNGEKMKWIAYLVIIWELCFFLSLFGGFVNDVFLIVGVLFHGLLSIGAGINFFFWAFIACYPAVCFVGDQIHQLLF